MPQEVAESALVDLLLLAETDMLVTWGSVMGRGPRERGDEGRGLVICLGLRSRQPSLDQVKATVARPG